MQVSDQWDDGVITANHAVCVFTVNCVVIKSMGVLLKTRDVKVRCRLTTVKVREATVKPGYNTASSLTSEVVRCRLARLIGSGRRFWQMEGLSKKKKEQKKKKLHEQPENVKGQSHYPRTPAAHQASTNQQAVFSPQVSLTRQQRNTLTDENGVSN